MLTGFANDWTDNTLHPAMPRLILPEIHAMLHSKDQEYFETVCETSFACSLDNVAAGREAHVASLRQALRPLTALHCWRGPGLC